MIYPRSAAQHWLLLTTLLLRKNQGVKVKSLCQPRSRQTLRQVSHAADRGSVTHSVFNKKILKRM